jgi:hypothetical protein
LGASLLEVYTGKVSSFLEPNCLVGGIIAQLAMKKESCQKVDRRYSRVAVILPNSTVITKLGKFPDMVSILEPGEVNSRRWGFRFI